MSVPVSRVVSVKPDPKPARTLADVSAVAISCEDCGRERVWYRKELRRAGLDRATVADLHRRLYCPTCRACGSKGHNIRLRPIWPRG